MRADLTVHMHKCKVSCVHVVPAAACVSRHGGPGKRDGHHDWPGGWVETYVSPSALACLVVRGSGHSQPEKKGPTCEGATLVVICGLHAVSSRKQKGTV